MRIPDQILKSIVFIGKYVSDGGSQIFKPGGTAFIVRVPTVCPELDGGFDYLVTARHNADELVGCEWGASVNVINGKARVGMTPRDARGQWLTHPTEADSVDVAVWPWVVEADEDIAPIPTTMFLTEEKINYANVGSGDEVFITGLFSKVGDPSKNVPIVRTGNVATMDSTMRPTATIGGKTGPIDAYLIEARSIGGLSGSPVFVHETVIMPKRTTRSADGKTELKDLLIHGEFYLLGLMHGHWEMLPKNKNAPEIETQRRSEETVNIGIAVVVPAKKILEVLNHPELVQMRKQGEETALKKKHQPTDLDHDLGENPPLTKEEFEKALKQVSRKVKPAGENSSESGQETS